MTDVAHQFLRVELWQDATAVVVDRLRSALAKADPFDDAAAVYVAGHERRARAVRLAVRADYPEGTPERVARTLIARLAPEISFVDPVDRDFMFFAALEKIAPKSAGRALVNALLAAFKQLCAVLPPQKIEQAGLWLRDLGPRGDLLAAVVEQYTRALKQVRLHDPETVLWLAAKALDDAGPEFAPGLGIVDDLDTVSPARREFIEALLHRCKSSLTVLHGRSEQTPHLVDAHAALQDVVLRTLDGRAHPELKLPALPRAATVEAWLEDRSTTAPDIQLVAPQTRAAEVRSAAAQIKRWAQAGVALDEICVSLPRAQNYRELVEDVFVSAGIPFDAPLDSPLSQAPPVAALSQLVACALNGFDRIELLDALSSPYLPFGDRANLARLHVLTRDAGIIDGSRWAEDWLRRLQRHDPEAERNPDVQWLGGVFGALAAFAHDRMRAVDFFAALNQLVERSGITVASQGKSSGGSLPAAATALHEFGRLCRDLARGFGALGDLPRETAELFRALREQCDTRTARPPEDDTPRVSVLGLIELGARAFSHVIVLGLTDRDLPLAEPEGFFFGRGVEKAIADRLDEPTARALARPLDVALQADWLFARMLTSGGRQLVLSFPRTDHGDECAPATQHARLLRTLGRPQDKLETGSDAPVSAHMLAAGAARLWAADRGKAQLKVGANLRAGLHGRGIELVRDDVTLEPGIFDGAVGALPVLASRYAASQDSTRPFSPSQLDTYAQCPQRFWGRYLLGVKEAREPTRDTAPWAVGTLIHEILHRFVLLLRDALQQPRLMDDVFARKSVRVLDLARADENIARARAAGIMREALKQAREAQSTPGPFWGGIVRALAAGLDGRGDKGLLARFIDFELARNKLGFGVRWAEFAFGRANDRRDDRPDTLDRPLKLTLPDGEIWIQGSIDRVDDSPQGLVVIDYKSNHTRKATEVRDGAAFQLPVYLAALREAGGGTPAGMVYLRVPVAGEIGEQDATRARRNDKNPAFEIGELIVNKLPQRLSHMLGAMRAGVFAHLPFTPAGEPCEYCELSSACARRDEVIDERQRNHTLPAATYLPDNDLAPAKEGP